MIVLKHMLSNISLLLTGVKFCGKTSNQHNLFGTINEDCFF